MNFATAIKPPAPGAQFPQVAALQQAKPAQQFVPPQTQAPGAQLGFVTMERPTTGRFILLVGAPSSGKTTACMTFPNPRFINLDNKLPAGAVAIPFHDPAFCDKYAPRAHGALPPNRRDAVINWLLQHVHQLSPDTTLILDSFSSLSDAFHLQAEKVEDIGTSKAGNKALLKVFGAKLAYLEPVFSLLKLAPCRVVVTAHTMPDYDAEGNATGGVKPFCTGSFSDKLAGYATDTFLQYVDVDPNTGRPKVENGEVTGYRWWLRPGKRCLHVSTFLNLPPTLNSIRARWQDLDALITQCNPPTISPEAAANTASAEPQNPVGKPQ